MFRPSLVVPLVALLGSACAGAPRAAAPAEAPRIAQSVPFRAVGHNERTGALIESYEGVAYVAPEEVRVVLTGGFARLRPAPDRRPTGLAAGLAFRHPDGRWDFRRISPVVPVGALRLRGDTLADSVVFRIRNTAGVSLPEHWLVIQQYSRIRDDADGRWYESTRPVNSPPDLFRRAGE